MPYIKCPHGLDPRGCQKCLPDERTMEAALAAQLRMRKEIQMSDPVNHPNHYGGKDNPYEAIKVITAWDLGFALGNTVKYISRAGKKDSAKEVEDLSKAAFYLNYRIQQLKLAAQQTVQVGALSDEICTCCNHVRGQHDTSNGGSTLCSIYKCSCAGFTTSAL